MLRFVVTIIIVLAAIAVLAVCGEGFCGSCADFCCVRSERSEPVRRVVRTIAGALLGFRGAFSTPEVASRGLIVASRPMLPSVAIASSFALRI